MQTDPRAITNDTRITLRLGGFVQAVTLGAFLADNADGDLDVEAIRAALSAGERYRGGGGAAPEWSVEVRS